jgi:hypothetical protein
VGIEQEKRLLESFAVRTLDGCEEPVLELGVAGIETEGIRRLGQLCKEADQTDETLALLWRMLALPRQALQSMGHAPPNSPFQARFHRAGTIISSRLKAKTYKSFR